MILVRGSGAKIVGHAVLLLLVFGLPAQGLGSARDVWRRWRALGLWTLAGTLMWDLWTAGIGTRRFLSEWPLVYGSSLVVFFALFLVHGMLVSGLSQRKGQGGEAPAGQPGGSDGG